MQYCCLTSGVIERDTSHGHSHTASSVLIPDVSDVERSQSEV
jgi:hypothetical protein